MIKNFIPTINISSILKKNPDEEKIYLTRGKFKATKHRVLWNRSKRMSIPFFFEPSYDFKMNQSFFINKKLRNNGQIYEHFLNKSLKKFIEYQR